MTPVELYFVSLGGVLGLGNMVAVVTPLLWAGPGALFWLWVMSFVGVVIKYAEIYLGVKYCNERPGGVSEGGLLYFLPKAFTGKMGSILAKVAALFLCIYGIEIYQFTIVTDALHQSLALPKHVIVVLIMVAIGFFSLKGARRFTDSCTVFMPLFVLSYMLLCVYVIVINANVLPELVKSIVKGAFEGQAAIGGFAGSTMLMVMKEGASRAVYSSDIAIGFDSVCLSGVRDKDPHRQARLSMLFMLVDASVCTLSILVVMISGLWYINPDLPSSEYVGKALSVYVPHVEVSINIALLLAGLIAIQTYFAMGLKAAEYLSENWGKILYYLAAIVGFYIFAYYDQTKALLIMSLSGGGLVFFNIAAMFKLRKELPFDALVDD